MANIMCTRAKVNITPPAHQPQRRQGIWQLFKDPTLQIQCYRPHTFICISICSL